jgi:hypothetical protein
LTILSDILRVAQMPAKLLAKIGKLSWRGTMLFQIAHNPHIMHILSPLSTPF